MIERKWRLWRVYHAFDSTAQRTGECSLGSITTGCPHKINWYEAVRFFADEPYRSPRPRRGFQPMVDGIDYDSSEQ
jgi:hypothetical protein